jgi:hypothetical protein
MVMSRTLTWAFVAGLIVLMIGLLAGVAVPSSPVGVALVMIAVVLLGAIAIAIFGMAWRTKGWSLRHPGQRL